MDEEKKKSVSRFLSLILRHKPDIADLTLDPEGWVDVDTLIRGCAKQGRHFDRTELDELVRTNAKQRFTFSGDGKRIRANQGHSTKVDLGYAPIEPPDTLFHGTVTRFLAAITESGLQRMQRHHVHLSPDETTARSVGSRRGKAVILAVDSKKMYSAGYEFYRTPNNVWLTDEVPSGFIRIHNPE